MTNYAKYPFVRMLIPFALGIWCCVCLPGLQLSSWILIVVALVLFALCAVTFFVRKHRYSWLFGVVMSCYLLMVGYALAHVHEAEANKKYFKNTESDATYYVARVFDCPTERENSIRAVLSLEYQFGDSIPSHPVTGRVMAYFPKTDSAFALRYGDLIAFPSPIREVTPPLNPEEFDYQSYLLHKGITGQFS